MSYSFDYAAYHFIALHHNPRHSDPDLGVHPSMAWLAQELASATAQVSQNPPHMRKGGVALSKGFGTACFRRRPCQSDRECLLAT